MEIYERLEELDADKAEVRASRILFGLGFTPTMQHKKLKDFSGGWRMRVSLARYDACMIHLRLIKNISCNDIHSSTLFLSPPLSSTLSERCSLNLSCCYWMNPLTTLTWMPACGWRRNSNRTSFSGFDRSCVRQDIGNKWKSLAKS